MVVDVYSHIFGKQGVRGDGGRDVRTDRSSVTRRVAIGDGGRDTRTARSSVSRGLEVMAVEMYVQTDLR